MAIELNEARCACGNRLSIADTDGECGSCRYPPRVHQRPPGQAGPDPDPRAAQRRARAQAQWADPEKRAQMIAAMKAQRAAQRRADAAAIFALHDERRHQIAMIKAGRVKAER